MWLLGRDFGVGPGTPAPHISQLAHPGKEAIVTITDVIHRTLCAHTIVTDGPGFICSCETRMLPEQQQHFQSYREGLRHVSACIAFTVRTYLNGVWG